ncbi:hypothetical protein BKI51_08765 [Alphaproteobacteria bacterium AO1-B]|nr:hypothetical protein BKI51_08765 [Alphaproteobacteria bacterium AO1-B]
MRAQSIQDLAFRTRARRVQALPLPQKKQETEARAGLRPLQPHQQELDFRAIFLAADRAERRDDQADQPVQVLAAVALEHWLAANKVPDRHFPIRDPVGSRHHLQVFQHLAHPTAERAAPPYQFLARPKGWRAAASDKTDLPMKAVQAMRLFAAMVVEGQQGKTALEAVTERSQQLDEPGEKAQRPLQWPLI